jgi:hypothetical protein
MGEKRRVYKVLMEKPKGKNHSEDRGVDSRMGSKRILGILDARMWCGFTWLRIGMGGRLL